jgi:hypothetical protein
MFYGHFDSFLNKNQGVISLNMISGGLLQELSVK